MATGRWGGWVLIWIPRTRYGQSGGGARAFVLAAARHVRSVLTELARARAPCQVEARATRSKVKDYAQRVREQNQRELAAKAQQAISRGRPAPGAKTAVAKAERKRIPTAREKAMEYAKTQVPKPEVRRAPSPALASLVPNARQMHAREARSTAHGAPARTHAASLHAHSRGPPHKSSAGARGFGGGEMSDLDRMLMQHELDQQKVRGLF